MSKLKQKIAVAGVLLFAGAAWAQTTPTMTSGTTSTSSQTSTVSNTVVLPSGGTSDVTYHGGYDVRTTPTVYAPALTASVTETCWGSISAAVSVVGVGATAAGTIKDMDCNKRLNAAVAWRMDRKDIAFNIMCQEDDFREAAALTDHPCGDKRKVANNDGAPVQLRNAETTPDPKLQEPTDPFVREREHLPALPLAQALVSSAH
ncbi:hypothetical protein M3A49_12560 [Paraburkholderia sp. CNPSo 3076]|uniref:hypothetical protein n=1 Tax=Paraburkholderia sp. CNPSo 3076 TaxID=2940936 RepID=UPI002252EAEB|nr:hypothetical protein [Paraburkholderia sp. CNPSo 3076]MCX5540318.1 hypothetical protein [Paraburkholderia sp. CNPSo 3076]